MHRLITADGGTNALRDTTQHQISINITNLK